MILDLRRCIRRLRYGPIRECVECGLHSRHLMLDPRWSGGVMDFNHPEWKHVPPCDPAYGHHYENED